MTMRSRFPVLAIAVAVAAASVFAGAAEAKVQRGGTPVKHGYHPVHGAGSSHNPIVYHGPRHGAGSSHNPIVVHRCKHPNCP